MQPSKVELAWIAGFFDGEGCVRVSESRKDRHRQLFVMLYNTHFDSLDFIRNLFGGSIHVSSTRKQTCYSLIMCNRIAAEFVKAIAPYSLTKCEQIAKALGFIALKESRNRYKTVKGRRHLRQETIALEAEFASDLRYLKRHANGRPLAEYSSS